MLRTSYIPLDFTFNIGHRNPDSFALGTMEIKYCLGKRKDLAILDNFVLPLIGKIIRAYILRILNTINQVSLIRRISQ